MAAAPAEKKKAKWGYTDSKGKKVTALQDMTDGGGYGGSGGAYATMSNEQYRGLKGPERGTTKPAGFYRQSPDGKGEHLTGLRGVMANPVYGGLLGLLTGGPMGAAMGFGGQSIRNNVRAKGGLLNALGAGQQQANLGSSPRPQIRPANLALPQVASPNQSYLGPFDPRVSTGQVDFGTNAFGPLSSIGLNSQALNGFNPTGDLTPAGAMTGPMNPPRAEMTQNPVPIPESNKGFVSTMPSGMSELRYIDYMRNRGIDVDRFPDVVRQEYQNYLNTPSIQGR